MKSEEDFFYQFIGNKIKEFRVKAHINQEKLAEHLKLSRTSIVNIESGRQHPTLFTLLKISKFLNRNIGDFFPDTKNKLVVLEEFDISIKSFIENLKHDEL